MSMVQEQIKIENQIVNYYKTGTGKPLFILHGWGASSKTMISIAQCLSTIRSCYILDFPGFGDSPAPESAWDVSDYAKLVQQFIERITNEPSDLLVHSFGGRITLKLLSSEWGKQCIDKVIITGGAGMKPKRTWRYYYKSYLAKTAKAPFLILPNPLREKGLNKLRKTSFWKSLGSSDYSTLQGVMREIFVKTVSEYLEKHLNDIQHEVLLLWGKNDTATPMYQAERLKNGIKNATLIPIENAGHYAFLDQPQTFCAIANAYFNPNFKQ